jgi:hypothetical protein
MSLALCARRPDWESRTKCAREMSSVFVAPPAVDGSQQALQARVHAVSELPLRNSRGARLNRAILKSAELSSGLGAIFLGAGGALFAQDLLSGLGIPLLSVGIAVHGAGMTLKHRLEAAGREPLVWERALFWACWAGIVIVGAWVTMRLFTRA